jgi:hypothetical protein
MADMTDLPPSASMSDLDLFGQYYLCPDCGKQGVEGDVRYVGSFGVVDVTGLDLEGCEGCRKVLRARGGAIVGQRKEEKWPAGNP